MMRRNDRTRSSSFVLLAALLLLFCVGHAAAQQPAPSEAKQVTIYGTKIHYIDKGTGPVVILLHGLGGSGGNWALNTPALADGFRVIVPDQVGFGQSDKPIINYRIATYVDWLDALYKELKIERASLVGNSMGGWIAAAYALAHPDKVDKLVLVDSGGFAPPENFDMRQLAAMNPSTREGMKQLSALLFFNKLFQSDAAIDAALTSRVKAGDGYTINSLNESVARREDFLDNRLGGIRAPTLIIWGRNDGLTPLAIGERFKKEIAGSELLVIDQAGHFPQLEKAAEFNNGVIKFLAIPLKL
jgi:pimeloyl-ACP methyl ester carboxylesterase